MDLILLALIIAGIVWAVRNRGRLGLLGKPSAQVRTTLVSGVVTGSSRHVETETTGSGSGTVQQGFNMNVSSTSVLHQQFFVRQDDGIEKPVHAWGLNLPVADGQRVTVIYSEAGEQRTPGYLVNHNAQQGWPLFSKPSDVAVRIGVAPTTPMIFVRAFVAGIALLIVAWVLSGVSAMASLLAIFGFPVVFLVVLFRDRARRRSIGAMLLEEYKNRERELLATRIAAAG